MAHIFIIMLALSAVIYQATPQDNGGSNHRQLHMYAFKRRALLDHNLTNMTECVYTECARACLWDARCGSFNYFAENLTCVLNEAVEGLNIRDLTKLEESTFYGRASLE